MRVAVLYPPLAPAGLFPVLTQSRVFSFTHSRGIRIFPLVMAQAATSLKRAGFEVAWLDGIAARSTAEEHWRDVERAAPDLAVVETKAPVVRRHWEFIRELKGRMPGTRVALAGDHVSFFPRESLEACPVDFVVTGGDYDAGLVGVARFLRGDADGIPGGVWGRDAGGPRPPAAPYRQAPGLDFLPWIDRELTRWRLYGEAYLHRPAAYVLSGRGCGGTKRPGRCTFCIWQHAFWNGPPRLRSPEDVAREIHSLAERYGVREVFDDNEAGGIWDLDWLRAFARELERLGIARRVMISSNCRADSVTPESCALMRRAGYRLLKIALESGNDLTLARLAKDETVEEIVRGVKMAKDHGFAVLVSVMVGFPWEGEDEAGRTLEVARDLLNYRARCGDCLEANLVIPYPGTPLHRHMRENGWLAAGETDYDLYGRTVPVVRSPVDAIAWGRRLWRLHLAPAFVVRTAASVRSAGDVALCLRGLRSLGGHARDYAVRPEGRGGTPSEWPAGRSGGDAPSGSGEGVLE